MPQREVDFSSGSIVGSGFLNNQQDVQSPEAWGVRLEIASSTVVRVPVVDDGGTGRCAIRIDGKPRFNNAAVTLDLTGITGTRDIYAVAGAGPGFTLAHTSAGAAKAANTRKIGELDMSGGAIARVRNTLEVAGHGYQHRAGGPDPIIFPREYPLNWAIAGELRVTDSFPDEIPPAIVPVRAGQNVRLIRASAMLGAAYGGSVTMTVMRNGGVITGLTGIVINTVLVTDFVLPTPLVLANNNWLLPRITAVTGTPVNLTLMLVLEDTPPAS